MVININPNRINTSSTGSRKTDIRKQQEESVTGAYTVPKRADVNIIPSVESLATLIRSAVSALRQGVRWDRGTILNLLV